MNLIQPEAIPFKEINTHARAPDLVRRGLYQATHDPLGTASAVFGTFPVEIAGKTGTAEKAVDPGDGIARLFNQSWWCGYGPYDKPTLVVCALIENGGPRGVEGVRAFFPREGPVSGPDPQRLMAIDYAGSATERARTRARRAARLH